MPKGSIEHLSNIRPGVGFTARSRAGFVSPGSASRRRASANAWSRLPGVAVLVNQSGFAGWCGPCSSSVPWCSPRWTPPVCLVILSGLCFGAPSPSIRAHSPTYNQPARRSGCGASEFHDLQTLAHRDPHPGPSSIQGGLPGNHRRLLRHEMAGDDCEPGAGGASQIIVSPQRTFDATTVNFVPTMSN